MIYGSVLSEPAKQISKVEKLTCMMRLCFFIGGREGNKFQGGVWGVPGRARPYKNHWPTKQPCVPTILTNTLLMLHSFAGEVEAIGDAEGKEGSGRHVQMAEQILIDPDQRRIDDEYRAYAHFLKRD